MKKRSLVQIIGLLTIGLVLVGCGDFEKDPIKDYRSTKEAVPLGPQEVKTQSTITSLFEVDLMGEPTFVQGQEGLVQLSTRLYFSYPDEVRYNLKLIEAPTDLGLQFKKNDKGQWDLVWNPPVGTLKPFEIEKEFPVVIEFTLDPTSSDRVKKQFVGQYARREFKLRVAKSQDQPIIENNVKTIRLGSQTEETFINPDDEVEVRFVVASQSISGSQELKISIQGGPEEPSQELMQMDALVGPHSAQFVGELPENTQGQKRFEYKLKFKAKPFVESVINQVMNNARWKRKFQLAKEDPDKLTVAEAVFYISALNTYNNQFSANKMVILNVNLKRQPGEPKVFNQREHQVVLGQSSRIDFIVEDSKGLGDLDVISAKLGESSAPFSQGKVRLKALEAGPHLEKASIECSSQIKENGQTIGCISGQCLKFCSVEIDATQCDMGEKSLVIQLEAQSAMGGEVHIKALPLQLKFVNSKNLCPREG